MAQYLPSPPPPFIKSPTCLVSPYSALHHLRLRRDDRRLAELVVLHMRLYQLRAVHDPPPMAS